MRDENPSSKWLLTRKQIFTVGETISIVFGMCISETGRSKLF